MISLESLAKMESKPARSFYVVFLLKPPFRNEDEAEEWDWEPDDDDDDQVGGTQASDINGGARTVRTLVSGNIDENLACALAPYLQRVSAYTTVFGKVDDIAHALQLLDEKLAVFVNRSYVMMPKNLKLSALQDQDCVAVTSVHQHMLPWNAIMYEGGMTKHD